MRSSERMADRKTQRANMEEALRKQQEERVERGDALAPAEDKGRWDVLKNKTKRIGAAVRSGELTDKVRARMSNVMDVLKHDEDDDTPADGERERKRDKLKRQTMRAGQFLNTAAMRSVGATKTGLRTVGDATVNLTTGAVGATVSGTRTGLATTLNATVGVVNLTKGGVDKLLGREQLDMTQLEVDESEWNSWSRAAASRLEAGGAVVDDDLDFRDMARLEKVKAQAIEWELQGHAEDLARSEALTWLAELPHDPLDCSPADFDELTEELARLSLRLQRDTVDMCKANWNDFKRGLAQVEALEEELVAAKFVCGKGRESLGRARHQLEESNVAAQFRKKQVLQEVCAVMSHLKQALDKEDRAGEALALRQPDFALARSLCEESRQHLVALLDDTSAGSSANVNGGGAQKDHEEIYAKINIEVGRDVLDRLLALEQRVDVKVKDGLREVCKDLDPSSFKVIFKAYLKTRKLPELGEEMNRYMLSGVDDGMKNMLFTSLAANADKDGINVEDLPDMTPHARAAALKPERVLSALIMCLEVVCQQLLSLQGVLVATDVHVDKLVSKHIAALLETGQSSSSAEARELVTQNRTLLLQSAMDELEDVSCEQSTLADAADPSGQGGHVPLGTPSEDLAKGGAGTGEGAAEPRGALNELINIFGSDSASNGKHAEAEAPRGRTDAVEKPPSRTPSSEPQAPATNGGAGKDIGKEKGKGKDAGGGGMGGMGSMFGSKGSAMWGQMKKAAATTATASTGLLGNVIEESKSALAIMKGDDVTTNLIEKDKEPHGTRNGGSGAGGGGESGKGGGDFDLTRESLNMMSASASVTISSMSYLANLTTAATHATLEAMTLEKREAEGGLAVAPAPLPEATAVLLRQKLLENGWVEKQCSDVEQAWVLQAMMQRTRTQVWHYSQTRVSEMLRSCKLSKARLEEFVRIVGAVDTFMHFGESLTGSPAHLRASFLRISRAFCSAYHQSQLSTLQTALESDFWRPYPCAEKFQLSTIQELGLYLPHALEHLKTSLANLQARRHPPILAAADAAHAVTTPQSHKAPETNPFNHYDSSSLSLTAPPSAPSPQGPTLKPGEKGAHVMTAGTIKAARLMGKYLEVMVLIPSLAHDALGGFLEMFRYYVFTVIDLFSAPDSVHGYDFVTGSVGGGTAWLKKSAPPELQQVLEELEHSLTALGARRIRSCQAPLKAPDAFYAVGERCVAIESLRFLAHTACELRGALELLVPASAHAQVKAFYDGVVAMVPEMREAMYRRVHKITIRMDDIIDMVVRVKWDCKEMPDRHNAYVDLVHQRFLELLDGLEQMRGLGLPDIMRPVIMRGALLHVVEQLVEGYSQMKQVGENTPLILSSDINVLKDALELLPGMRPLPFFSHVELFTKGFFLPPDEHQVIVEWVHQHPFYPSHQCVGLVKAITSSHDSFSSAAFNMMKGQSGGIKTEIKLLLAEVTKASHAHVLPSSTMTLDMLVGAR
jgi:hypothetical protein